MHISSIEEYGVRCATQLARHFATQTALPASKIATLEGISVEYVSKIMHLFKKAKLIESTRGIQGGFKLSQDPSQIHLNQIFDALAGKKSSGDFCTHYSGNHTQCVHFEECSIRPVWTLISNYFNAFLKTVSLNDLLSQENHLYAKLAKAAEEKAKALSTMTQLKLNTKGNQLNEKSPIV